MAAQQAASEMFAYEGVVRENTQRLTAKYVGVWANADTMEIVVPDYEKGGKGVKNHSCWTTGAGDPGARTHTYRTDAQVTLTSFNELTGVAVLTNASGGGITNPFFSLDIVGY